MDIDKCDLVTLFTFRYLLDKANDVVDLKQDVFDLQYFPERLHASYADEWRNYIKRRIMVDGKDPIDEQSISQIAEKDEKHKEYEQLKSIVIMALKINESSNVQSIQSPLKHYIEQLLKL